MSNKELFEKYISDELTQQEELQFYAKLKNSELDSILMEDMDKNNTFDSAGPFCIDQQKKLRQYRKIEKMIQRNKVRQWMKYAAIMIPLVFLTAIGFLYLSESTSESKLIMVSVLKGEQKNIVLADGTQVWINADSRIWIPEKFARDKRVVKMEGEVYFDVTTDKEKPFSVLVNDIEVKVHGTRFNVKSYEESETVDIALNEGSIETIIENTGKAVKLIPGERIIVEKQTGDYEKEFFDHTNQQTWKDDFLIFNECTLNEVMLVLARKYNIKYRIVDEAAMNYTFTMQYNKEEINNILNDMELISPVKIEHNNNIIEIRLK
ncbi:MAG: FecR family protein [Bacteroidales bacterium]